ncbi:MAG: hypothetical protein II839_09705, partial [Kiritimatiellae bacterium]|nr:hypothetical protein [Kiritimatiellia bacterium]
APADEAKPAMPADASEAPTVRKKSLVLKKPAGGGAASGAPTKPTLKLKADPGAGKPAAADGEKKDGVAVGTGAGGGLDDIETPPSALSQGGALQATPVKVKKTHWIFPLVGFLDIAAIVTVIVYFMAQTCGPDRSLTDYTSFKGMFDSPLALGGSVLVQ